MVFYEELTQVQDVFEIFLFDQTSFLTFNGCSPRPGTVPWPDRQFSPVN